MTDPSIVPWIVVWFGLVTLVCGVALVIYAVVHPRPKRLVIVGPVVVVLGLVLMIVPVAVNGFVMLERAFSVQSHTK